MKNTRKLIPALAMLLISAIMVSTASFAWFSMNTTVEATGMQIAAKSDQTFLLISATNSTAAGIQAEYEQNLEDGVENPLTATVSPTNYTVYPAAVKKVVDGEGTRNPENDSELKFYYAVGESYEDGTAKPGSEQDVTSLADYVVTYKFYITVAKGASAASDIVVKSLDIYSLDAEGEVIDGEPAVGVVVATAYNAVIYETTSTTTSASSDDESAVISSGSIKDTDVLTVNVYVYYNGNNANVTTENAANLKNTMLDITFGVKNATQQPTDPEGT